jgi:hypothetical protein
MLYIIPHVLLFTKLSMRSCGLDEWRTPCELLTDTTVRANEPTSKGK